MQRAEARMAQQRPRQDVVATVARFVEENRLCNEVDLGLRLLSADQVRKLLGEPSFRRLVRQAGDRNEAVLKDLTAMDPEAGAIARVLRGRAAPKDRQAEKEDKEKSHKHRHHHSRHSSDAVVAPNASGAAGRRSRSRRRRREHEGQAPQQHKANDASRSRHDRASGSHNRHSHSKSAGHTSGQGNRDARRGDRRDIRGEGTALPSAAGPSRAGGVWDAPDNAADEPPLHGGYGVGGGSGDGGCGGGGGGGELEEWLMGLDGGRGTLAQYLEPLQREFGDLPALAATVLPTPTSASVVGHIDASLWAALGVEALGHKLTLAKGLVALCRRLSG